MRPTRKILVRALVGGFVVAALAISAFNFYQWQEDRRNETIEGYWPTLADFREAVLSVAREGRDVLKGKDTDAHYGQYTAVYVASACLAERPLLAKEFKSFVRSHVHHTLGDAWASFAPARPRTTRGFRFFARSYVNTALGANPDLVVSGREAVGQILALRDNPGEGTCLETLLYPGTPEEVQLVIDLGAMEAIAMTPYPEQIKEYVYYSRLRDGTPGQDRIDPPLVQRVCCRTEDGHLLFKTGDPVPLSSVPVLSVNFPRYPIPVPWTDRQTTNTRWRERCLEVALAARESPWPLSDCQDI